jgi:hypothetical protein
MYRFEIDDRSDGGARITCGEHVANDERALARKMVNAGAPDGPIEAGRTSCTDYRVRSLHAFAATAIEDGERGLLVRPYRPHEKSTVTIALQTAISLRECAVKNRRERAAAMVGARKGAE